MCLISLCFSQSQAFNRNIRTKYDSGAQQRKNTVPPPLTSTTDKKSTQHNSDSIKLFNGRFWMSMDISTIRFFFFIIFSNSCIDTLTPCCSIWEESQPIQTQIQEFFLESETKIFPIRRTIFVVQWNWRQTEVFPKNNFDSNTSGEPVYMLEHINYETNNFFADTDVILVSYPDLSEKRSPFAWPFFGKNSKFIETESTAETITNSGEPIFPLGV